MSSVTHFTQHVLRLDPQKSAARLCLFNFLKFYRDKDETITAQLFDEFYGYILNFPYWQEHALDLGREVAEALESFAAKNPLGWNSKEVIHADQIQIVPLRFKADVEDLIRAQHNFSPQSKSSRIKILQMDEQHVLSIVLATDGSLRVKKYACYAAIKHGALALLSPMSDLQYTAHLELCHGVMQMLDGGPRLQTRFIYTTHGCHGNVLNGHTLQKYESLSGMSLSLYPEVYHALKKIERFYIQPESDPFYQDLITMLEKIYQVVSQKEAQFNPKQVEQALQKGKSALKNIFPNDKLLLLLVTNIEYLMLNKAGSQWNKAPEPSV